MNALKTVRGPAAWMIGAALLIAPPAFAQMSPLDRSNPAGSGQDTNLKPHATPSTVTPVEKIPLDKVRLPNGFKAEIWSHGHPGGRTMVRGDKGTVFMGTRLIGRVYAITDRDGKREVKTLLSGLTQPNGLAFRNGSLYVLAINRVLRYDNIEDKLDNPDGKLYIQVGAPCNICEVNPGLHAQIRRYNADGTGMEIMARGVRNTVGFDWHPVTGELWFTDNGRDWAGDFGPQDELNRLQRGLEGGNFGFPYCHAEGIPDPQVRVPNACAGVIKPAALIGPHAGALGLVFYTGSMFPAEYRNSAFVVRRGSWNRAQKFGYDVAVAVARPDGTADVQPFLSGLLDTQKNEFFGRPTYALQMPDGALLVSDEFNGAIYRISYAK